MSIEIMADFEDVQPEIKPGDVIRITPGIPVSERDFALVMIGDQILCRKIKRYVSGVFLISENKVLLPEFYSMEELEKRGFKILGKIVERIRHY